MCGGECMSDIKCKAHKCVYNEKSNCVAKEIEVNNCGCQEAHCSDQTECATFKPKDM